MAGKIVDFSHHQGNVDFKAAKADGLELAIIRVQYGSTTIDRKYKEYVTSCKANGIPFGHYAYARFVSVADAIQEAKDFVFRADKAAKFLVVDVEELTTSKDQIVAATQAFIDYCKGQGFKVGLYTGHHFYKPYNMDQVKADFLWIPRYGSDNGQPTVKPDYPCDLWQFTQKGKIAGVAGYVDLNQLNGSKPLSYFIGEDKPGQAAPKPQPTPQPAPKPAQASTYIVKSGDTLSEIAAKHNTTVAAISALNGISNPNKIYVGQTIKLSGSAAAAPKPAAPKATYHVVKSGEVLGKIAAKYGTSVGAIQQLNSSITNPNKIYVGQKIRVK
jgi:GH25 family lysozyme M1 (1,4-beta-N-acetylmuramidase)